MKPQSARYPITISGQKMLLQFQVEESPTKRGVNLQFILEKNFDDPRDKQDLQNKLSVVLQKKFGDAGITITYNDRNPYENVISFIVPMNSIADLLIKVLRGG